MKKALFLATSMLLAASMSAQETTETWYQAHPDKTVVESADDLVSGMYYLYAHCNQSGDEGLLINRTDDDKIAFFSFGTSVPPAGTIDSNLVWQIDVTETDGEKTFTIKNVNTQTYFTLWGQGGKNNESNRAVGNVLETTNVDEAGIFRLVELPANYIYTGNKRFHVQITNSTFANNNYPFLHTNSANATTRYCSYWELNGLNGTALHIEFIPVRENPRTVRDITVNLPALNGQTMSFTVKASDNYSAEGPINFIINEHGGMKDIQWPTDLTVSATNTVFNITGSWLNAFYPNQVYRISIKPNDRESPIRYDVTSNTVLATNGGVGAFSKIIPERMWYFVPVENETDKYYMYTLAHPDTPLYFENNNDGHSAILSDNDHPATMLQMETSNWGSKRPEDICLKIADTNNYLNQRGTVLSTWNNTAALSNDGSAIRLYALSDNDFEAFKVYSDDETAVEQARQNPTYENILPLVQAWDDHNILTAIRRGNFYGDKIGTAIGKYNTPDNNYSQLLQRANELMNDENADPDEIAATVTAMNQIDIVYPKPGEFLRFKNRTSGKYMTSTPASTSNRMSMGVTDINQARSNTIFYYHREEATDDTPEKNYLVCFDDGRVVGTFSSQGSRDDSWRPVVKDAETEKANAATEIAFAPQGYVDGLEKFVIHTAETPNHRHLHGNGDDVNVGDGTGNDYQWIIERVEWLPIPFINVDLASEGGWASIYTPVELIDDNNRVDIYTAEVKGDKVIKTLVEGNKIPAHTPVLLDYKKAGVDGARDHYGYVYLKVNYPQPEAISLLSETEADTEATTPAAGRALDHNQFFATPREADKKYFTLHATDDDFFTPYSDYEQGSTYIPGFKAHIAVPIADAPEKFEIIDAPSTTIESVEVAPAAAKAVYDLQGRRLAAPAKGINIVNGKKVLVK